MKATKVTTAWPLTAALQVLVCMMGPAQCLSEKPSINDNKSQHDWPDKPAAVLFKLKLAGAHKQAKPVFVAACLCMLHAVDVWVPLGLRVTFPWSIV